ncbi:MAG: hypothetical protein Q9220_007799 [cf. Caloplaca sp. 1 TL-2023]
MILVTLSMTPWQAVCAPGPGAKQKAARSESTLPERPPAVGPDTFHGSQFAAFDDLPFTAGSPAVDAAPVFLFSRTGKNNDPCYPESAVVLGSNPPVMNPGTDGPRGPASINPGVDCTNPGPYTGEMSPGDPFPVYVGATWCEQQNVWKLNYDVYYVHDGSLSAGHKHDWEGVTIVFAKHPDAAGGDWWYRAGATYNHHQSHDWFEYDDLVTVSGASAVGDTKVGKKLEHPKVYVGFFSHSAYASPDTAIIVNAGARSGHEYRSDDWWRIPQATDMHSWREIDPKWNYGAATSNPSQNRKDICGWQVGKLSFPRGL